jgi:archaellum component FlaD/FlaE
MNGEFHEEKLNVMSGYFRRATGKNQWQNETVANLAYQAHLIQLMFTDQLLGQVIDK